MKDKRRSGLPVFSSQITATVSVTLVLLTLGVAALMGLAARSVRDDIRSRVGFVVVMADDASAGQIEQMRAYWASSQYVASVSYASADDVLHRWQELMTDNDDVVELLGVNPFSPEFEINVHPQYADEETLNRITAPVRSMPGVGDVRLHTEMIGAINSTIRSLAVVLLIVAAAMLMISFVLINNTVRLTVYSRRFIIHTMKLVGATGRFIRRPFMINNLLHGIISGFVACALLAGVLFYVGRVSPEVAEAISWIDAAWVFVMLFLLGVAVCTLAALFATNRYLRADYDEMFK